MSKPFDPVFIVKLDLDDLQDYSPQVQYCGICSHLKKLALLESAICDERHRLIFLARYLEGKILYYDKEVSCERNS